MEKLFYEVRLLSFRTAFNILNDIDNAEDIAQSVCCKLIQNFNKVKNPLAWCVTVTRNEVLGFLNKKNKQNHVTYTEGNDQMRNYDSWTNEDIEPEFGTISRKEAKELLDQADYEFYQLMIKYNFDNSKISMKIDKKKQSVYHLSYRVKRNLVAAKLLKEGYRGTRRIVSYNLHQNINNFTKLLIKKIKDNDLTSLRQYLKDVDEKSLNNIDIATVLDYELRKNIDESYSLAIPYLDSNKNVKFCLFDFVLNINNRIVITYINTQPEVLVSNNPKKVREKIKPLKKGLLTESSDEMDVIFKNAKILE